MTLKNNRAPLQCYFKICASFRSHWWIQTGVTVRKPPIWVKIDDFLAVWPWNLTDDLQKQQGTSPKHYQDICFISSSYVNSNWNYSPETPNLGQTGQFLEPRDLEIWRMTFKNNREPLLCYFKLCASFRSYWWIQTGVSPETPNLGQIWRFLEQCDLAIWRMTLENNRAPLLFYFKLCAPFRNHWCIETWVTVRKRPIWVKFDYF